MDQVSTVAAQAWLRLIMTEAGVDVLTLERIDDNGLIVRAGNRRRLPWGDWGAV